MTEQTKKVVGTLVGVNGNAFALMGHFQRLAKQQGWSQDEIKEVLEDAMSSDYDHLVYTLDKNMTSS